MPFWANEHIQRSQRVTPIGDTRCLMAGGLVNRMQAYHHKPYDELPRIKSVDSLVKQSDRRLMKRSSICTASYDAEGSRLSITEITACGKYRLNQRLLSGSMPELDTVFS